jgi:hypothetical protein
LLGGRGKVRLQLIDHLKCTLDRNRHPATRFILFSGS